MTELAYLERRSPADNLARFYRVAMEPGLFGDVAVVRQWGRIGANGQELRTWHGDPVAAERVAGRWIGRKRRRGYQDGPLPYTPLPAPTRPHDDHSLSWGRQGAMIAAGLC